MANPYVSESTGIFYSTPPNLGTVGQVQIGAKEWLEKYGTTMCTYFEKLGAKMAELDGTGTISDYAKTQFDKEFGSYQTILDSQEIKTFAWNCFVQGYDSVSPTKQTTSTTADKDDGWGLGTWLVVLGGVSLVGLFGYNLYMTNP